ncbi:hypothetical protein TNCV_900501 [Trichonephila clavipes]|nr:hypothetical protein TNCV_900501 [Trichonephila clavipes]
MHYKATRGPLATDLTILNLGKVMRTKPEPAPSSPNYHINEMALSFNRFNVHHPALHGTSSVTPRLESATLQPRARQQN